jgi:hypothetical protein
MEVEIITKTSSSYSTPPPPSPLIDTIVFQKDLYDDQGFMILNRRESHRRAVSGECNDDRKRRYGAFQSLSVNVIVMCLLLWIMTTHRSILWQLSNQRHDSVALETSDFVKLSVGSSLATFGHYHHSNKTRSPTLEQPASDSLASMNLPIWMKGIFNILFAHVLKLTIRMN